MPVVLPVDVEFQIPMRGRYVVLVRKGIRTLAIGAGFSENECQDIEVAVGEAVTNAIRYGRPETGAGRVRVRCKVTSKLFAVEVEDEGQSKYVPPPKPAPCANNEHGRGWALIHKLMDRVSVRCTERGMLVRMFKRLPTPSSKVEDATAVA